MNHRITGGITMNDIQIREANPRSPEATALIRRLSAELSARYGNDGSGAFNPSDVDVPGGVFVVAWWGDFLLGCGALRPGPGRSGEIKRMYVDPEVRGRRIARQMLDTLESYGRSFGYQRVYVETSLLQQEALRLYKGAGYTRVEDGYGQSLTVCFEKYL
jgi:putative acetyltransferase